MSACYESYESHLTSIPYTLPKTGSDLISLPRFSPLSTTTSYIPCGYSALNTPLYAGEVWRSSTRYDTLVATEKGGGCFFFAN